MSNVVREKLEDYFSSMNPTSKRMMADILDSRRKMSSQWDTLKDEEQSEIIWKSIVKPDAIEKYEKLPSENIGVDFFPVLRTRPGEKIIVDEDASAGRPFGSSWRDEHSAPFRWETQSQLDLSLEGEDPNNDKIKAFEKPVPKSTEELKVDATKDEDMKRPHPVKRPEVPPPPVPPHASPPPPPVAPHVEILPIPVKNGKKDETPIYAKVMKRKNNAKTLLISEMKAHRRAKEEMKPAVPPRMSLELKGEFNAMKYKTLPIDFESDIPKTGFDFLDNW